MLTVASLFSEETQAFPDHSPEILNSDLSEDVVHLPSSWKVP